ncbi:MAG TPA: T9SS type A sorting domain-containing protein, partial [Chitinophagales bacterium]|nr:T9SS type A sorting domain-containing protein [Chitinophagales bacterium]
TLWTKFYGNQHSLYTGHYIINVDDSSFAIVCSYMPDYTINPYYEYLLLKLNYQGDTLWSKTYSLGIYNDGPACILLTQDGGFIIGGFSDNFPDNSAYSQAWILKTDSVGNIEWSKTYGFDNASEIVMDILQNYDGTYTVCAARSAGSTSTWVFKIDQQGNPMWNRVYGNGNFTYPYSMKAAQNGYIITGVERIYGFPNYGDGFVLKIDTLGNQQTVKLYGGPYTDGFTDLLILENNQLIVLGAVENNGWGGSYADAWLMKLTAEGDSLWSRTYAYNGALPIPDYVWGITDTPEGGFMFAGFTSAFNTDSTTLTQTAWVVRTDSLGNACYLPAGCEWAVGTDQTPPRFEGGQGGEPVVVYPNPAQNLLHLQDWQNMAAFNLYSLSGKVVCSQNPVTSSQIVIAHLPAGLYIAEAQYKNGAAQRQKLLIHR